MSKRRLHGEIVQRNPGSGFSPDEYPKYVKIPEGEESDWCMLDCGDRKCREWPNLLILDGPDAGQHLYHISECQVKDAPKEIIDGLSKKKIN